MAAAAVRADDLDDLLAQEEPPAPEESANDSQSVASADAGAEAKDGENGGEAAKPEGSGEASVDRPQATFYSLPSCRSFSGTAEVLVPGAQGWVPVEENRHYALGSLYRTVGKDSRMTVRFGLDSHVLLRGDSSFGTRAQAIGDKTRQIVLAGGTITVKLPSNLKDGLFSVNAPGFTVCNLSGESRYTYEKTGDGDSATIRCVSQKLTVKGRHFELIQMRGAQEVKIRTSQDMLFTALYGTSGDILARLEQGRVANKDFSTGEMKVEDKFLDWKLSPLTSVKIHRAVPAIGEKLAVSTMTFDKDGNLVNRCAFTEKTVGVNSGEIGPTTKKDREELAKRAADATAAGENKDGGGGADK